MKVLIFALLALAVGAYALPQDLSDVTRQERIIDNQIRRAIEDFLESLRVNGYDPYEIIRHESTTTIQPGIILYLKIVNLDIRGVSVWGIDRLEYSLLTNRLRLNMVLPEFLFSLESASGWIDYHGSRRVGEFSGTFAMRRLSIGIDARMNVGVISGISIRTMDFQLRIPEIRSDFRLVYQGEDLSDTLNELVNGVPQFMRENQAAIDRFLSDWIRDIGNQILG